MKRTIAGILGVLAVLGVLGIGLLWWMGRTALGLVDEATDATARGVKQVAQAAHTEIAGAVGRAQEERDKLLATQPKTSETPAPHSGAAESAAESKAVKEAPTAEKSAPQNAKDDSGDGENVALLGKAVDFLAGDDDDPVVGKLAGLLGVNDGGSDKASDGDRTEAASSETDSLTSLIPGGDSPTVQKVIQGKYAGKEGQIVDDALEDPKAWRLLFFLGGF